MAWTEEDYFTEKFSSDILRDIVFEENIVDPVYETNKNDINGRGFLSNIIKVKAKGKNKEQAFIIKAAQQNKELRKQIPIKPYFVQEITYYKDIFPTFEHFQSLRMVKSPFKAYPKCYKSINNEFNEILVLENLQHSGFMIFEKSRQMDDAHVKLVLREYGRFHAISLAMKDKDHKLFEDLTKNVPTHFWKDITSRELFGLYGKGVEMAKAAFDSSSELKIIEAISNFSENIVGVFENLDSYKSKSSVFVHGDSWYSNMMFKYQDTDLKIPIDVRFFDFQFGKYTTPVVDISYFLYSCMTDDILNNLDYYLKIYHDSLRDYMYELGSDVEKYYPFASLLEEWKVYCKFGVTFSSIILRVTLRDDDEAATLTDAAENTKFSLLDTFFKKSKNEDLINQRYRSLFLHLYKRGCI